MKTSPKTTSAAENFSWLEAFKSVWYFLENDRAKFTFYFFVLMIIFFYELLPSYIVGKIIDFISSHESGESLRPFYYYVLFISTTYVLASFIRLKSKFILNNIGQNNRTRARIWGFERLTEFSLEWHNKENTGNKIQRIFTGADGIRNLSKLFTKDILRIFANITGVAVIFLFTDFKFVALIFAYIIIFLYIEFAFSKKFFSLSNEFNAQNQSAGGTYMESANNMLSIKAMGGEKIMAQRVFDKETFSRDINIRKSQTVNLKWRFFQFLNGIALGVFLYFTGTSVLSNVMTIGMVLVFYTYFLKLQGSLGDMCDMHSEILDCRSDIASMMPIFKETEFIKTGKSLFPKNWKKIELKNVYMNYGSGQIGLSNFNLSLPRGSKTGIAGLSGSGKSTLTKIILGLYGLNSGSFKIGDKDYYSIRSRLFNIS